MAGGKPGRRQNDRQKKKGCFLSDQMKTPQNRVKRKYEK
jgi:hypothetical protein